MPRPDKGKGRAAVVVDDERQPLLASSSSTPAEYAVDMTVVTPTQRRWHRRVFIAAISILVLALLFFLGLLILVIAGVPRGETQDLWEHVIIDKPSIHVLNVSDAGVHVNVTAVGGVDVKALVKGEGEGFWNRLRRKAAYGMSPVVPSSVAVTAPEVLIYARGGGLPLINVTIPEMFDMPLMFNTEPAPFSIEAVGHPVASAGEVWTWAQKAWAVGEADVVLGLREVHAGMRNLNWLGYGVKDLSANLRFPMPKLPNLPRPGRPLDLGKLVKLHHYSFTNTRGLQIAAAASLPNPGVGEVPYAPPFSIAVNGSEMAQVIARTSGVSSEAINILIAGDVTALKGGDALETFLRRFLRGKDSPIVVKGLNHIPEGHNVPAPPQWVLDTLPSVSLDLVFPGPKPKPEFVKSVTIENMHISELNGGVAASGTVVALVELPDGFRDVTVNVTAIKPDVFVFDGALEDSADDEEDAGRPDPENPPERAFGRIAPDFFLNSTTAASEEFPGALEVRADFENMPLQILENRQGVFRSFVGKIFLHGGATAGISGAADIRADLGVGDPLDVAGLPVHGEFWVGRQKIVGF